ncbi:MAG: RagB/SusD family nutrient uptake outer membrane protein [Dysgonamonadaceae bacterium]|jgi:hypothetical protein|nr:RagB/SusD family nutrient uptake outer membrane protein [Dysgonamonadaceae bacterium]
MKNTLKIFSTAIALLATTACDDFLTVIPEDQQVLETYYTSEAAIDANTASLYAAWVWQDFHTNFMWMAGDELAGDLFYTYAEEGQFYSMTFTNTNTFMTAGWNGLYRVVSYCNNIINGMPDAARMNDVSETAIDKGLAEARLVRAFAYYFLTEYWKDVPVITNNNMQSNEIVRHTQKSVYEFMRRDLEFAKDHLPATPYQSGRATRWTAIGMLAKLHLTMASHLDDGDSAANFEKAKAYAREVIENSGLTLYNDLGNLFYPAGNNNSESLFAIQCTQDGYAFGNARNVSLSRNALINLGNSWGAGKGATRSLQEAFEPGDARRINTFMRNGDHFDNLGGGGYFYENFSADEKTETFNEMLNHVRKYVIGADADCGGKSGASNQDAPNNIYLLRLADVYLVYVEACIGAGTSTTDALAIDVYKQVRARAGLTNDVTSITYDQLIKERRVEFALESINFFDIKRMSYRAADAAVAYLNGMERWKQYVSNAEYTVEERNAADMYHGGFTSQTPDEDPAGKGTPYYLNPDASPITITAAQLVLPLTNETIAKTPRIRETPVDYTF